MKEMPAFIRNDAIRGPRPGMENVHYDPIMDTYSQTFGPHQLRAAPQQQVQQDDETTTPPPQVEVPEVKQQSRFVRAARAVTKGATVAIAMGAAAGGAALVAQPHVCDSPVHDAHVAYCQHAGHARTVIGEHGAAAVDAGKQYAAAGQEMAVPYVQAGVARAQACRDIGAKECSKQYAVAGAEIAQQTAQAGGAVASDAIAAAEHHGRRALRGAKQYGARAGARASQTFAYADEASRRALADGRELAGEKLRALFGGAESESADDATFFDASEFDLSSQNATPVKDADVQFYDTLEQFPADAKSTDFDFAATK